VAIAHQSITDAWCA